VAKFIQWYLQTGKLQFVAISFNNTGTIAMQPGSGRKTVITPQIKAIVEEQMRKDDETTASQLHVLLVSLGYRLNL